MALTPTLLVDKSAYMRGLENADPDAELRMCAVTEMELLYSARSAAEYEALSHDLAEFRTLRMDAETFAAARTGQRELAAGGKHRVPVPDVLIAACAQQNGADILHVDRHYDTLAEVFNFKPVRLPEK
jgi:predicted nucleic acid-binding protein